MQVGAESLSEVTTQEPGFSGFTLSDAESGMFVALQEGGHYVRV